MFSVSRLGWFVDSVAQAPFPGNGTPGDAGCSPLSMLPGSGIGG